MRQEIRGPCKISHLSNRVCTIIKQGDPSWRVTYVGFDRRYQGTAFLMPWAKTLEDRHGAGKHCELRSAKRLNTKYEVKIWGLTKSEVLRINADLANQHYISFAPYNEMLIEVMLNGQFIGRMTKDCQDWLKEQTVRLSGLSHDAAASLASSWLLGT